MCRKLWRRCCSAKSSPRTGRRTLVIGTGYIHTSQTGEMSFQTLLRCSGRTKPAVACRPSRHVAVEEGQRWNNIHTDCDRCVFQTSLVRSAKEQVSNIVGGRVYTVVSNGAPNTLQIDNGTEFLNRSLHKLLKEHDVHHFATHNEETKVSIVDMFYRILNTGIWRYFTKTHSVRYVEVLQAFMRSYNDTYHRSIGMAPSEVTSTNQETVWQRLYGHESVGTPKFRVGDRVRLSKAKRHFEKGYMANWTEELLKIVDAHRSDPPVYLQKVVVPNGKTYRVESILRWRNKRREVLVKWSGYPTSFNSWIYVTSRLSSTTNVVFIMAVR